MKKLNLLVIFFSITFSLELFAQQQKLVTIEMFQYNETTSIANQGGGVSAFEIFPFVIKTTDENNEISYKTFEQRKRGEAIETFSLLREEIDFWLSKSYKLFSFNVTGTGSSQNRYIVLLTKEE